MRVARRANLEGTKSGGRHQIRLTLTNIDGSKTRKAFYGKTKTEAQRKAREFELSYGRKGSLGITFTELADAWESTFKKKAKKTADSYRDSLIYIRRKWNTQEVDSVGLPQYVRWLNTLEGSVHDHARTAMSVMLNFGRLNGLCESNPLSGVKIPRKAQNKHHRCSSAELAAQLAHIWDGYHPFILFLAHTGLRPWKEAIFAKKEHIGRLADETFIVVPDSKTKAGKGRRVPISDRFLLDYIDSIESGTLFPSITCDNMRLAWQRAWKHSGVKPPIYGLRSLAISKWCETESLDVVMSRAGHVDQKTTLQIYNEVSTARAVHGSQGIKDGIKISELLGEQTKK